MSNVRTMPKAEPIGVGSVVAIKSGGPLMTVRSINGELVQCRWFDVELTACSADFHICELVAK